MASKNLLAFDLGAESGRALIGRFDGERFGLEVIHRFANGPVRIGDQLFWDVLRLFDDVKAGLQKGGPVDAVGVDTWGVDFALLGRDDSLLGNPRHYRDPHTEGIMESAFQRVPAEEVFAASGIQFMRFNTLFQLLAMQRDQSAVLDAAHTLLMMPDLFHFWLSGVKANEVTNASTSACFDPQAGRWAWPLLDRFGLPKQLFGPVVQPGTRLGALRSSVAQETGQGPIPVIAPATHDTAAAVAAVPAKADDWCYISSGTWSLLGVELSRPVVNEQVRAANITNEGGFGGTTRFLKNIMGLWLVQECKRAWERENQPYEYAELARLAEASPPLVSLVDPDDPSFLLPNHMPTALAAFCERTGQVIPTSPGAYIRCALESLALKYRWVLEKIEKLTGRRIAVIHIVGGGSQNRLLNQFTADACGRPVLAGPVEATAIGNALTQAIGLGLLGSLADARHVVRRSFEPEVFSPSALPPWEDAYGRFRHLLASAPAA